MIRALPSQGPARGVYKAVNKVEELYSKESLRSIKIVRSTEDKCEEDDETLSTQAVVALQVAEGSAANADNSSRIDANDILHTFVRVRRPLRSVSVPLDDKEALGKILQTCSWAESTASRRPKRTVESLKSDLTHTVESQENVSFRVGNIDKKVSREFDAILCEKRKQEEEFIFTIHELEMLVEMEEDGCIDRLELKKLIESLRRENRRAQEQFNAILTDFAKKAEQRRTAISSQVCVENKFDSVLSSQKAKKKTNIEEDMARFCTSERKLELVDNRSTPAHRICSEPLSEMGKRQEETEAMLNHVKQKSLRGQKENMRHNGMVPRSLKDESAVFQLEIEIQQMKAKAKALEIEKNVLQLKCDAAMQQIKAQEKDFAEAMKPNEAQIRKLSNDGEARITSGTRELSELKTKVEDNCVNIRQLRNEKEVLEQQQNANQRKLLSMIESKDKLVYEKDRKILSLTKQRDHKESVIKRLQQKRGKTSKANKLIISQRGRENTKPKSRITCYTARMNELESVKKARLEDATNFWMKVLELTQKVNDSQATIKELEAKSLKKEESKKVLEERIEELEKAVTIANERTEKLETEKLGLLHDDVAKTDYLKGQYMGMEAGTSGTIERLQEEKLIANEAAVVITTDLEYTIDSLRNSLIGLQNERDGLSKNIVELEHIKVREAEEAKLVFSKLKASIDVLKANHATAMEQVQSAKIEAEQAAKLKVEYLQKNASQFYQSMLQLQREKETLEASLKKAKLLRELNQRATGRRIEELEIAISKSTASQTKDKEDLAAAMQQITNLETSLSGSRASHLSAMDQLVREKDQAKMTITKLNETVSLLRALVAHHSEKLEQMSVEKENNQRNYLDGIEKLEKELSKWRDSAEMKQIQREEYETKIRQLQEENKILRLKIAVTPEKEQSALEVTDKNVLSCVQKELRSSQEKNAILVEKNADLLNTIESLRGEVSDRQKLLTEQLEAMQAKLRATELAARKEQAALRKRYILLNSLQKQELRHLQKESARARSADPR